jgi:hypothetical protein
VQRDGADPSSVIGHCEVTNATGAIAAAGLTEYLFPANEGQAKSHRHLGWVTFGVGGANEVKAFRRGTTPQLVSTIPVGSLPHGIRRASC